MLRRSIAGYVVGVLMLGAGQAAAQSKRQSADDCVLVGSAGCPLRDTVEPAERAALRAGRCRQDPRVALGLVSFSMCIGAELFFRETFDGNGRTCGSCHPAQNNYTLDAKFIATLPDDDPLFIAEQNPVLSQLEIPELMRKFGLILVNPDGFSDPTHLFVVRGVSHMLGIATSTKAPLLESAPFAVDGTLLPPLERLGWSGDAGEGKGELRDFADGAIKQHLTRSLRREVGVDFVLPNDEERDAMAEFSRAIGRLEDVHLMKAMLKDPGAERGRDSFFFGPARECGIRCHNNAGANMFRPDSFEQAYRVQNGEEHSDDVANFTMDTGTIFARLAEVDAMKIPIDGGHGKGPGEDLDGDGISDLRGNGAMNIQSVIEAADTEPLFHTHAAATLEDAITFYTTDHFAKSLIGANVAFPGGRPAGSAFELTQDEISDVGRFLRVVNTALNTQMANYRLSAALEIAERYRDQHRDVQRGLIELAAAEVQDAVDVLGAVQELHVAERELLQEALRTLQPSCSGDGVRARMSAVRHARDLVCRAEAGLGTGLQMKLGAGTLLF